MKRFMALVFLLMSGLSYGQTYPGRTITLLVPASPATTPDTVARLLAPALSQRLGQPVIVENRTGASGTIGIGSVAKAAPDGYTILVASNTIAMVSWLYKGLLTWDPLDSFTSLARIATSPSSFVVNSNLPVKSVSELVALAKSKPGTLNFATPGVGSPHHLVTELFKQSTGINIFHIPFKTAGGALTDVATGQVQMAIFPINGVMPHVKSGRLRVLATLGDKRTQWTPDVPTMRESGIDLLYSGWVGAFLPRATPKEVVTRVSQEIKAIVSSPEFQELLFKNGMLPDYGGPEEMAELLKNDLGKWNKVVTEGRIELQ
jgi:tripartite-type tricarboxylate transporter receptor subunit TctC